MCQLHTYMSGFKQLFKQIYSVFIKKYSIARINKIVFSNINKNSKLKCSVNSLNLNTCEVRIYAMQHG